MGKPPQHPAPKTPAPQPQPKPQKQPQQQPKPQQQPQKPQKPAPQPPAQKPQKPAPQPPAKKTDPARDALYCNNFSAVPQKQAMLPCGKPVEDKPCCVKSLSVKCGHGKRGFVLTPPKTKTNTKYEQVIQLLADQSNKSEVKGHNPIKTGKLLSMEQAEHADHDKVVISFNAGPCVQGKGPMRPAVVLGDRRSPQSITLDVDGPRPPRGPIYLTDFLQLFLGNNPAKTAKTYAGSVDCCKGGQEFGFRVEVFPYRKWAGKISIGHELGTDTQEVDYMDYGFNPPRARKAKLYSVDDRGTFKITGSIEVQFGGRVSKVELPTFEKSRTAKSGPERVAFAGTKRFFERVLPRLHTLCSSPMVTIKPIWPNLSLSGETETVEVKGAYDVGYEGKVAFKAEPLIGLSGSTDLLNWLIVGGASALGAPTAGLQLAKLKKKAEEGFGGGRIGGKIVCKIEFTASGQVGGGLEWQYKLGGKNAVEGALTADLDFELKGEVSIEVRVLIVSYQAGASISGKTGVGGEIKCQFYGDEPGFSGKVKFKGLVLEAVVLHSAGGSSIGTEPSAAAKKQQRQAQDKGRWDNSTSRGSDSKVLWKVEVLEPAEWPSSDKASLADGNSP